MITDISSTKLKFLLLPRTGWLSQVSLAWCLLAPKCAFTKAGGGGDDGGGGGGSGSNVWWQCAAAGGTGERGGTQEVPGTERDPWDIYIILYVGRRRPTKETKGNERGKRETG
ncbi:hypothetical protein M0802_001909 [Mischocyttarus mexicanus]|nr:hypothetical protein M0802_001909 [Mischocyttarus mexicanus]